MIETRFKKTEIGEIPEEWEVKRMKDFATLINGRAYKQEELLNSGKYRVLRVGNFFSNESWYYSNLELNENQYCNKGDLLYAWSCTYGAYLWNNSKTIYHYHIWKIIYKNINKKFLYYLLNNDIEKQRKSSQGSTMSHITKGYMEMHFFSLPISLIEQQRIATALSDIDTLLSTLTKKIEKKKLIKQGAMQQLLTGKKRLAGFTDEWKCSTIWEIASCNRTLFNDGDWIESPYITDNGYWLVQTGNIGTGFLKYGDSKKYISHDSFLFLNCKKLLFNDILICRLAEPAGRSCLYTSNSPAITSVDVSIFRPDESIYNRLFLVYMMNTVNWLKSVSDKCGGSTRTRISRSELGTIKIYIPSTLEEQSAIATILSDMDKEIEALEAKRTKYTQVKQGMMQQLLTGKIRLVD